jgi:hypothetical protein
VDRRKGVCFVCLRGNVVNGRCRDSLAGYWPSLIRENFEPSITPIPCPIDNICGREGAHSLGLSRDIAGYLPTIGW